MLKKTIFIQLLIITFLLTNPAYHYDIIPIPTKGLKVLQDDSLLAVNVTLDNGTVLSYSTVDVMLENIYKLMATGKLSLNDITNVTVLNWYYYTTYSDLGLDVNSSICEPAYNLFFYRIDNGTSYNYSGNIVASTWQDYLNAYFKYEGLIPYGKILNIKLDTRDGLVEKTDISEFNTSLILVVNASSENSIDNILERMGQYINSTRVILIDTSNNASKIRLPDNFIIANFSTSSINLRSLESIINDAPLPVVFGLYNWMIVWKSIGYDSIVRAIEYIKNAEELGVDNYYKIGSYRISHISSSELYETKMGYVVVYLTEGIGNATIHLSYIVLDENNETISSGDLKKDVSDPTPVTFDIYLKNGSRILKVNVSLKSDFGVYNVSAEFKVIKLSQEKNPPKIPWTTIIAIIFILGLFVAIVVYYKRYSEG